MHPKLDDKQKSNGERGRKGENEEGRGRDKEDRGKIEGIAKKERPEERHERES